MENNGIVRYKGKPCIGSNVVMLPIDDKTIPLPINMPLIIGKLLVINLIIYKILENSTLQPQHLYITTDEEIKEGDWYIYNNQVEQCKSNSMGLIKSCNNSGRNPLELLNIVLCRKIIASSDEALKIITSPYLFKNGGVCKSKEFNLPQPSQSFIKEYCDKGGIDEVNVEYEHDDTVPYPKLRLKVDSHNTITIHPIKDSWTREEVEELLSDLSNDIDQQHYHNFDTNNWIKQNL